MSLVPDICIIVPVYNVELYLRRCIESILAQTFTDFEIILVDDGSTDGSPQICDAYAARDSRIRVIHKENGGLSSARNAGIDIVRSKYVSFIDSDDYIHPYMYEILYNALVENGADISICDNRRTDGVDIAELKEIGRPEFEICTSHEAQLRLFGPQRGSYVTAWAKLYKTHLFDGVKYPDGRFNEDSFVTHIIYSKAQKIAVIHECLYYYYINHAGIMLKKYSLRRLDEISSLESNMKYYQDRGLSDIYKKVVILYLILLMVHYNEVVKVLNDNAVSGQLKAKFRGCFKKESRRCGITIKEYPDMYRFIYPLYWLLYRMLSIITRDGFHALVNKIQKVILKNKIIPESSRYN